jgi:AGZA family xanthine/uracil permease-like MFS transporter
MKAQSCTKELLILLRSCARNARRCLERSFEIRERGSTLGTEILCGILHFVSSLFILPVIPMLLGDAGYDTARTIQITALASGVGCIASSYITNLPFVVAPLSSVAIYVAVALQENGMNQSDGDATVILSGFVLLFIGICQPVMGVVSKLIPDCIQASTAIGIGLITALAGATELTLVVPGRFSILQMGEITAEITVAFFSTVLIAVALYRKVKGAYTIGLLFGTFTWWIVADEWPTELMAVPHFTVNVHLALNWKVLMLLCNLAFLCVLTINGLARTLSDLAHIANTDGSVPRGSWLFIMCGVTTIVSGYFSGPPILISPESAPGIKSGARTGFSVLVCGVLYIVAVLFCPLLEKVPPAGTSPLLILVGLTLFVNSSRINWGAPDEAVPAFFVLLLIPFTYSILTGVSVGYAFYLVIGLATGQLHKKFHSTFLGGKHKLGEDDSETDFTMQRFRTASDISEDGIEACCDNAKGDTGQPVTVRGRSHSQDRFSMDLESNIKPITL